LTASTFGWLDHDEGERRRMMEVINLFREKGTLDEAENGHLVALGARPFNLDSLPSFFAEDALFLGSQVSGAKPLSRWAPRRAAHLCASDAVGEAAWLHFST
jgi:hypothetical protein